MDELLQEFLDTVVLFSRGKTEDKLRIIFDMCDNDRNGVIDKGELSDMLRSLVEIARTTSLSDAQVTELIDGMFQVCVMCFIFLGKVFYQENRTGSFKRIAVLQGAIRFCSLFYMTLLTPPLFLYINPYLF